MKTNINVIRPMKKPVVLSCALAVLGCLISADVCAQTVDSRMTTAAWDAYNTNNFPLAISNATACVKQFQAAARLQQQEVQASGIAPPIGEPKDEKEKKETQARGPLNAVATCWFIKGDSFLRSSETNDLDKPDLDTLQKARDAFKATLEYSHGRCWDTNGFFWSPALVARRERLPDIERTLSARSRPQ
jgi:hypothetical protein